MDKIGPELVAVLAGIVTLATIAVIFGSKNSSSVLQAGGSAFSGLITAAVSPVVQSGNGFGTAPFNPNAMGG